MSYQSLEASQQGAFPVELYQFLSNTQAWRYSPQAVPVVYGGNTYTPEATICSNIGQTGDAPKDNITIKLPIANALAQLYLGGTPDFVVTVAVFRTHYNRLTGLLDAGGIVKWMGRIVASSATVSIASLVCEPISTSMLRLGLQDTFQRSCTRRFGKPGCNVDREAYKVTRTIVSVAGSVVTLNSDVGSAYVGGDLKTQDGSVMRKIIATPTGAITLMRAVSSLAAGQTVTIYRGCDKSTTTCATVYNNMGNNGAWPGIPYINPMSEISVIARG